MRLDKILENIKASESPVAEKTASDYSDTTTRSQLMAALHEATATSKVAAATPMGDLMKLASDVAATEQEMAYKEAQLLGQAFADAVVSRVGEWQAAATKTASYSAPVSGPADFDKFASDNTELVKQAAELGYMQTRDHLEKVAAAEYERGYNDTMEQVQKLAANEFAKAAQLTGHILETLAAQ